MKINAKKVSKMMTDYKMTRDEELFTEILKEMEGIIYLQSKSKMSMCNSNLNSLDDFMVMSQQIIWEAIEDFKFICPCCGIKAKTKESYTLHMQEKHLCGQVVNGKTVKMAIPYSEIYFFVVNVLKNKLSNVSRDENTTKKLANSNNLKDEKLVPMEGEQGTYDSFANIESRDNTEELVISKDVIRIMIQKIEAEGKKVHLFLLEGLMKGHSKTILAQTMADAGIYKNVSSAKCSFSRVIKDLQNMYLDIAN